MKLKLYKYICLFIFICSILAIQNAYANIIDLPLFGKIIYIDPGHPEYL